MLRRLLGMRARRSEQLDFTDEDLDYMWDDDTIDIKNFSRMEDGPAKREMYLNLKHRMNWYIRQGLQDWAEQINVALWLDGRDHDRNTNRASRGWATRFQARRR